MKLYRFLHDLSTYFCKELQKIVGRDEISRRIKALLTLEDKTVEQAAGMLAMSEGRLANLCAGRVNATDDELASIARAMNGNVAWLATGVGSPQRTPHGARVAVIGDQADPGRPPAGFVAVRKIDARLSMGPGGVEAESQDYKNLALREDFVLGRVIGTGELLAAEARGDSMQPFFWDRDTVFVDPLDTVPEDNQVYVIADSFGKPVVKELRTTTDADGTFVEIWERFPAERRLERIFYDAPELPDRIYGRVFLVSREVGRLPEDEDLFRIVARKLGLERVLAIVDQVFPLERLAGSQ